MQEDPNYKVRYMVRTVNSMVVKHITWPHELIYKSVRQPTVYEQLTMPLFVSGYTAVLAGYS